MIFLRLRNLIPLLLLVVLAASCTPPSITPTVTIEPVFVSPTPAITRVPATRAPTSTITPTPTRTPRPPTPTPFLTATPELLACPAARAIPDIQAVRLIYANDNRLWIWDEASGSTIQLPLPEEAIAPLISDDGRLAAYVTDGQEVDTPQRPVERIPLRVFDTQAYIVRELATFSTVEVRRMYPDSPQIYLQIEWLPGGHLLLVQVFPYPWNTGILQPTGPMYVVDADTGASTQILLAGEYERYAVRPDGKQIAVLDSQVFTSEGQVHWDLESYQRGALLLIDVVNTVITFNTPVRLPADPWNFTNPVYSPDGGKLAYNSAGGIEIANVALQSVMLAPLTNTCLEENNCYWTDSLPVYWLPDSRSFYTIQSVNDYFDQRAEATLSRVYAEQEGWIETLGVIHANQGAMGFSPDRSVLTFWNHPDLDSLDQGDMNWDVLRIMNMQERQPRTYTAEYVLRVIQWHPDNRRFLYISSPHGGANPVTTRLTLGDICQPPSALPVPEGSMISRAQWLLGDRFLAWTVPSSGLPDRYPTGLYLYDLARGGLPTHIADLIMLQTAPYGVQEQVVVIRE